MELFEHDEKSYPQKYENLERMWKEQEKKNAYEQKLAQGFFVADKFLTQRYLDHFSAGQIIEASEKVKAPQKLRAFEITKIVYDPEEQINDKFISVYSSLHNLHSSIGLLIRSEEKLTRFYAITRCDESPDLAGETLRSALKGNFPGIEIREQAYDK